MSKPFRFGSAVSLVALATMIASCAAAPSRTSAASSFGGRADGDIGLATRALIALNSNDIPTATNLAERAVAKTPDDAGFRALLGNAYFAGGRFSSAEAAYKDALSIYSNQPQVVLKLALVEIGLGKNGEAIAFLEAGRSVLDPADSGLALALAGRASDAVSVLEPAARERGADARVRQNLALAYAFAGDWINARTIAAQDVPANQLDARIQQWMQLTNPARPVDQVAALVGVTPAATDPGQPVQLALREPNTRMAQAAPAPQPQPQPQAAAATPASVPQFEPAPQVAEAPVAKAPEPSLAPVTLAMVEAAARKAPEAVVAAAREVPAAVASFARKVTHAETKPAKASAVKMRPALRTAARHGTSGAVVQLGAYGSPQRVSAAWSYLTQRYPALRGYLPMRARFDSPKGTFWRLSITGFANQREAIGRCQLLRSRGGNCFVRNFAGDAPVQYASR